MAFWSALRRRPEEEDYSEAFDEYDYEDDYSYENTTPSWGNEAAAQPIRSAADMQIALVIPKQYSDASKIADLLRDMKFVVLNLSECEPAVARRLLDFISGVTYAEDGNLMKVATNVYVAAPYFVDMYDETSKKIRSAVNF